VYTVRCHRPLLILLVNISSSHRAHQCPVNYSLTCIVKKESETSSIVCVPETIWQSPIENRYVVASTLPLSPRINWRNAFDRLCISSNSARVERSNKSNGGRGMGLNTSCQSSGCRCMPVTVRCARSGQGKGRGSTRLNSASMRVFLLGRRQCVSLRSVWRSGIGISAKRCPFLPTSSSSPYRRSGAHSRLQHSVASD
jgi:hypothetical protein